MNPGSFPALILMPDISGYTEFVNAVEIRHGQHIVAELLELLLASNTVGAELSGVEGDALLLYRPGPPPTLASLVAQARRWFVEFHRRLERLRTDVFCTCGACQYIGRMSLKIVAHHGEMAMHRIGGMPRLIGMDVILAHRLLKNDLASKEYLLLTGDLLAAAGAETKAEAGADSPPDAELTHGTQSYPIFGPVRFAWLDLAPLRADIAAARETERSGPEPGESFVLEETRIRADLRRVTWAVSDPDAQARWLPGVQAMHYDRGAPIGTGHRHVCIIDGMRLEQQVAAVGHAERQVVVTTRIGLPMPIVADLHRTVVMQQLEGRVQVRAFFAWNRRPFVGLLFDWMLERRIRTMLRVGLDNLRRWLEGEGDPAGPPASG